jgi:hypothetical protein
MEYLPYSLGSVLIPKLVGTYESELHTWIEDLSTRGYEVVLNIGCAEGYYAVGLALRLPKAEIYAYDIDPLCGRVTHKLAVKNGVSSRIHTPGLCSPSDLQAFAGRRVLVVCDIESAERELIDPDLAPALRKFDLLVETHDPIGQRSLHDLIADRFQDSHLVSELEYSISHPVYTNEIQSILDQLKIEAPWLDEGRGTGILWLLMLSRENS